MCLYTEAIMQMYTSYMYVNVFYKKRYIVYDKV